MSVIEQMLCLVVIAVSLVAPAYAQGSLESPVNSVTRVPAPATSVNFDIPAQPLTSALSEFARQSGQQLLFSPEIVTGKIAGPVQGSMLPLDALDQLLAGSGLIRTLTPSGAILINGADYSGGPNGPKADGSDGSEGAIPEAGAVGVANGAPGNPGNVEVAQRGGIEEIIVTGQKREERIQDVPIAISAFSMENLDNQKIEGGFDLLKAVPNVTFSKSNFSGYNFQIRGIGTQAISATTDPGVAISFNNTTLIVNRLFEQEYLDIERVEVLRGPQGTLFGRNATAGVINVISAKPQFGDSFGELKLETGNYGAQRARAHINMPVLGRDDLAMRAAFAMTKRDGYGTNLAATDSDIQQFILDNDRDSIVGDIDNRDLWTGRFSLAWAPSDAIKATAVYEIFEEDDRRMRSTKQLCQFDDGNRLLKHEDGSDIYTKDIVGSASRIQQLFILGQLSQGCLPGSIYDKGDVTSAARAGHGAYGTPNGNAIPYIRGGRGSAFLVGPSVGAVNPMPLFPGSLTCRSSQLVSNCVDDPLATPGGQSRDLRSIFSLINPEYRARSELVDLSIDVDVSDDITLASQTVWMRNDLYSTQDFLRFKTSPMFSDSRSALLGSGTSHNLYLTPNGIYSDPQLGKSDRLLMQDVSQQESTQFSQEIRLASNFDGAFNFSVGANYTRFENTADYFVFINALSAFAQSGSVYAGPLTSVTIGGQPPIQGLWGPGDGLGGGNQTAGCGQYYADTWRVSVGGQDRMMASCVHVQPGPIDEVTRNPQGHNFFLSRNPYELSSAGLFGEVYFNVTDLVKITAGLRMNWDKKVFTPTPSQTLLSDWRGRMIGGGLGWSVQPGRDLSPGPYGLCHPNSPDRVLNFGQLRNVPCALAGLAPYGMGYPTLPDIVQEWRVPTGRLGIDWKLDMDATWIDEALVYAFYTRGYKAGGANPPTQSAPSGLLLEVAQGASSPPTFAAEYVNAFELGLKSRLFGGAATINVSGFYYDYKDYQVSKIIDRTAVNENFDAVIWGLELETVFSLTPDTLFNANVGFLKTRIGDGEKSLDLMDRTQGGSNRYVDPSWENVNCTPGSQHLACRTEQVQVGVDQNNDPVYEDRYLYRDGFDHWVVIRPSIIQASSCVAPSVLVSKELLQSVSSLTDEQLAQYCPAGRMVTASQLPLGYDPVTSAPNGGAGFLADIGGNELPSAPRFTFSTGLQHTLWLAQSNWSLTARADWYWQDESYNRVYNTEYDRLRSWSSTNFSVWTNNSQIGFTVELYAKNIFDSAPITGAFLNSDDTGLSTNVFTLDPRLIGLSIKKEF